VICVSLVLRSTVAIRTVHLLQSAYAARSFYQFRHVAVTVGARARIAFRLPA
jgi:hypothetical protein